MYNLNIQDEIFHIEIFSKLLITLILATRIVTNNWETSLLPRDPAGIALTFAPIYLPERASERSIRAETDPFFHADKICDLLPLRARRAKRVN